MPRIAKARTVPNGIRYHRQRRPGMTQVRLAEKVGISAPDMNHIEHGRRLPTRKQALLIARALRCKAEDLWSELWLTAIMSEAWADRRAPRRDR